MGIIVVRQSDGGNTASCNYSVESELTRQEQERLGTCGNNQQEAKRYLLETLRLYEQYHSVPQGGIYIVAEVSDKLSRSGWAHAFRVERKSFTATSL
jgi:hypothetical protein